MKLVTFVSRGKERLGAILPDGHLLDLKAAIEQTSPDASLFNSMQSMIEGGAEALEIACAAIERPSASAVISPVHVRLCAPIPKPPRLRDTLLFMEHMENGLKKWAKELASKEDDPDAALEDLISSGRFDLHPVYREKVIYYNADHLSVSGLDDVIIWPYASDYADFELEMACVIGSCPQGASLDDAKKAIFGYTIYNDWSARDIQLNFMQANLGPAEGKDFSRSNTLGPCIVTPDEFEDVYNLRMTARVNGELWCDGSSAMMYHSFEDAIVQFSRFEQLVPGEVIGSGTVVNGCGYELDRRLSNNDIVELEIEGIGILRNTVSLK